MSELGEMHEQHPGEIASAAFNELVELKLDGNEVDVNVFYWPGARVDSLEPDSTRVYMVKINGRESTEYLNEILTRGELTIDPALQVEAQERFDQDLADKWKPTMEHFAKHPYHDLLDLFGYKAPAKKTTRDTFEHDGVTHQRVSHKPTTTTRVEVSRTADAQDSDIDGLHIHVETGPHFSLNLVDENGDPISASLFDAKLRDEDYLYTITRPFGDSPVGISNVLSEESSALLHALVIGSYSPE